MPDTRVAPTDALFVRLRSVVLLRDEVGEESIGQRLVAVSVAAGDVDRNRVVVTDVFRERLPGRSIEHHHAHYPGETDEEIVLAALVIVEATDHTAAGSREVQLPDRLRQGARTGGLGETTAVAGG